MKKIKIVFVLVCFSTFFISCREKINNQIPAGPLYSENIFFEFAIYPLIDTDENRKQQIENTIKQYYPDIEFIDNIEDKNSARSVSVTRIPDVQNDYPPPDSEYPKKFGHGMNDDQTVQLQNIETAYIFHFLTTKESVREINKNACHILCQTSTESDILWDEETRVCFPRDSWFNNRISNWQTTIPDLLWHTTIHLYRNGPYCRAITLGMAKYGLPDIVINNLSCYKNESLGSFINLICQTLAETGTIEKEGKLRVDIDSVQNDELRNDLISSLFQNAKKKSRLHITGGKRKKVILTTGLWKFILMNLLKMYKLLKINSYQNYSDPKIL